MQRSFYDVAYIASRHAHIKRPGYLTYRGTGRHFKFLAYVNSMPENVALQNAFGTLGRSTNQNRVFTRYVASIFMVVRRHNMLVGPTRPSDMEKLSEEVSSWVIALFNVESLRSNFLFSSTLIQRLPRF